MLKEAQRQEVIVLLLDLVRQGEASLDFSLDHLAETKQAGAPCDLAVQDAITPARVSNVLSFGPSGSLWVTE